MHLSQRYTPLLQVDNICRGCNAVVERQWLVLLSLLHTAVTGSLAVPSVHSRATKVIMSRESTCLTAHSSSPLLQRISLVARVGLTSKAKSKTASKEPGEPGYK